MTVNMEHAHIENPNIKVRAPDSMLMALGNCYVNLNLSLAGLTRIKGRLTGDTDGAEEFETPPTSVMGYIRACQTLSWDIDKLQKDISELIGDSILNDDGTLINHI